MKINPIDDLAIDPAGEHEYCYAVIRKSGRKEFYDVNSMGLSKESALLKANMVDEMKPEWGKAHPIVRVAKGRFIEKEPEGLEYE